MPHRWEPSCERPLDLIAPVRVDPNGLLGPTWNQAVGPRWQQTSAGKYVPAGTDDQVIEQRILEQAHRIGKYGAVTAWASLRWQGANFFDGSDETGRLPISLVTGGIKLAADPRVQLTQEQLAPSEWHTVAGIRVTTIQRALFDEVRRRTSLRERVVAIETAAAARLISVRMFALFVAQRASWAGVPNAREAARLAVDDSRSPQETRMRLCWVLDAGLLAPVCNRPVYDLDGKLLGIPDVIDPVAGLVGEYRGEDHKDGARHRKDVAREDRYRDHGLEFFEIVGGDLHNRGLCIARMLNARARAKFLPLESCAWTLEPPPWITPLEPLDVYLLRTGRAVDLSHT